MILLAAISRRMRSAAVARGGGQARSVPAACGSDAGSARSGPRLACGVELHPHSKRLRGAPGMRRHCDVQKRRFIEACYPDLRLVVTNSPRPAVALGWLIRRDAPSAKLNALIDGSLDNGERASHDSLFAFSPCWRDSFFYKQQKPHLQNGMSACEKKIITLWQPCLRFGLHVVDQHGWFREGLPL